MGTLRSAPDHIKSAPDAKRSWRRPMFPKGCPLSIFGAGELNCRVRYGNGCGLSARVTRVSCVWTCFGRTGAPKSAAAVTADLQFRAVCSLLPGHSHQTLGKVL